MLIMRLSMLTEEISHITLRWFCGFKPAVSENTLTFFEVFYVLHMKEVFLKITQFCRWYIILQTTQFLVICTSYKV